MSSSSQSLVRSTCPPCVALSAVFNKPELVVVCTRVTNCGSWFRGRVRDGQPQTLRRQRSESLAADGVETQLPPDAGQLAQLRKTSENPRHCLRRALPHAATRLPPGHAAAAQVAEGGASPPSLWTVSHWPGSSHFPLQSDASDSWRGTRGMRAALGPMGLAEAAHCGRVSRRHRACRRACQASLRGVRVRQTPTSASAQGARVPGLPHAADPPEQWQTWHPAGEDARVPLTARAERESQRPRVTGPGGGL